ncbi:uncharacterized protein EI97DRAFT_467027 [Westerdykella ornata]|uniref:RING-type domain-containing protein n=1 Tax=Westerdykella ornata TaxID=318751 RepID=A0A6A6JKV0_WESOR|nr:uncharacterized protein EI97DRAFT_467027 [Westerdykella ornata]KAF2276316.1 hypothetical protein EI97DRAFT_467027 [Westerdykella ornata]
MDGNFDLNFSSAHRRKNNASDRSLEPAIGGRMARKPSISRSQRSHFHMDSDSPPSSGWEHLQVSDERPSASDVSYRRPAALHLPPPTRMPPAHPPRYPGDGFDFRRPISLTREGSGHEPQVIDLTDDSVPSSTGRPSARHMGARPPQRPPRFPREIIDLDDESNTRTTSHPPEPPSPEVQFISMRNITPAEGPARGEDEVQITDIRPRSHSRQFFRPSAPASSHLNPLLALVIDRRAMPPQRNHRTVHGTRLSAQALPNSSRSRLRSVYVGVMNYNTVGFDMQPGNRPQPPPAPPTYDPPPPAPPGFTRSPDENTPVGCPNCENELCIGDTERQRQVWIVRACGHVYCGECAANRFVKVSTKGKDAVDKTKHKPFKVCVVDGCDKKTSNPKAMIQVFL